MPNVLKLSALLVAALLLVAACNGDDETTDDTTPTPAATPATTPTPADDDDDDGTPTPAAGTPTPAAGVGDGEEIEIVGVNYEFENVPDTAEPGTRFTFRNDTDDEYHELVLFRIPEGEARSITALLELPEEEASAIVGEPVGVSVAGPGEDGQVLFGDLTVTEPGRYVMICFIPVGADPAVIDQALQEGGEEQPDLGDGPPHFVEGMVAEFTVE